MSRSVRLAVAARLEVAGHERAAEALRRGTVSNHFSSAADIVTVNCDVAVPEELLPSVVAAEELLVEAVRASFGSNWEMGLDVWVQITALAAEEATMRNDPEERVEQTQRRSGGQGVSDSVGDGVVRALGEPTAVRLTTAVGCGVPPQTLAVAARWWQLETYLRQLIYIELRAKFGLSWETQLSDRTLNRADSAADRLAYMASPDDEHLLAHLDVGELFRLIGDSLWKECQPGVGMPMDVWKGRVGELMAIRHRMAHCRRPHNDDVHRLEQTLRDLEPAAHRALFTYADFAEVREDLDDPVVANWCRGGHEQSRLVEHGKSKGIWFHLGFCRRSWATQSERVSGEPGHFWMMFIVLDGQYLRPADYWADSAVRVSLPNIGHILHESPRFLKVTFPAVDDPDVVSDAIGRCFEAVFDAYRVGDHEDSTDWRRGTSRLDSRVDVEGVLSVLSGLHYDEPISLFCAT